MKICPKCQARYDDSWGICLHDQTTLFVDDSVADDGPLDVEPREFEPVVRKTREPKGVGGWLAVFVGLTCLVSVGVVIRSIASTPEQLMNPGGGSVPVLGSMVIFYKCLFPIVGALRIASCIVFFKPVPNGVKYAQAALLLEWIVLSSVVYIPRVFVTHKLHAGFIGGTIGTFLWITYLSKSKRVRNTLGGAEAATAAH